MKNEENYAKIYSNWRVIEVIEMLEGFKEFLEKGENLKLAIIIASFVVLFILLMTVIIIFNAKKKKYRNTLDVLRERIQELKQHEVIKNYSSYDNLKTDQKLGMLVLRWKKEIEKLVREVDAQYSMLDVLEDAIDQNNYQYFVSLKNAFNKDINELEEKANRFKDEIIEYIDMASDNRKYINKYREMVTDLKKTYINHGDQYKHNEEKIETYFKQIESKFEECHQCIEQSQFVEADNIASNIFKEIKILENYIQNSPKLLERINTVLKPKFDHLKDLANHFNEEELKIMKIEYKKQYDHHYIQTENIIDEVNTFKVDDFDSRLNEVEKFLNQYTKQLETELENKNYIKDHLIIQNENIVKVENTAKNFISIFKIVQGSYNITDKEIKMIEQILFDIDIIKKQLSDLDKQFKHHEISNVEIREQLENITNKIAMISKELDHHLVIIDEIYKDEQSAREQISLMTEKINGTKKYIKYANFDDHKKYLKIIRNLNLELTQLYMLLSSFPIDIVRLNDALKGLVHKVEKTTQDINGIVYKTLLTEFVLVYANRYFSKKEYQKDLLMAEELFYKKSYNKAYDKVMEVLEKINPKDKKIVLEKYQTKFSEIFA